MISTKSTFQAIASALDYNQNLPMAVLKSYSAALPGYARVGVTITHNNSKNNPNKIYEAIRVMFNGKASPVTGSWLATSGTEFYDDLIGMVTVNQQVLPYTDNMKGFRALSSNMFMDTEQSMWTLKVTEAGKLLVKTSVHDDDTVLTELMASLSSNRANKDRVVSADFSQDIKSGDYVAYVSKSSAKVETGFVVSTVSYDNGNTCNDVFVLGRDSTNYELLDKNMILSICSSDDLDKIYESTNEGDLLSTASSNTTLDEILAYYRMLYSKNADYFSMFEQRIRQHFCC